MSWDGLGIAATVLTGLPAIPLAVIWVFSLIHNRQYKDPARRGAGWVKGAIPVFFLALVVETVGRIYNILAYYGFLNARSAYPAYVSLFVGQLAALMVFIAFVETGLGFLHVHGRNFVAVLPAAAGGDSEKTIRPKSHVATRIGTYSMALVLFALAAASFGLRVRGFYEYYGWYASYYYYDDADDIYAQTITRFQQAIKLNAAFDIICWILTMPLIGFAGYVVSRCRGSVVAQTSHIYVAAACVWFARFFWLLIYQCGYALPEYSNLDEAAIVIVDPLMSLWFFMIVLILLFVIFAKKQTGLWSIGRPWMAYQAQPPYAPPANFGYDYGSGAPAPFYGAPPPQANERQLHEMHQTPSPIYTTTAVSGVSTPPVQGKA
ncbi:hypothetical protein F503_07846 [Ophiostoma piceae UAMH 11346]|uniref:Uncharacterized protein n=1 Tax=Ophiostoma piceae (strain UAMH 11346) TaxID=1262450 RepID=S3D1U1_OPHP1|nr:hypothetical protein F503_07846 [Ophiostoma piceae UAMH 11346]